MIVKETSKLAPLVDKKPLAAPDYQSAANVIAKNNSAVQVELNAAAALVAAQGTTREPVTDQLRPALARAHEVLASGAALTVLKRWAEVSQQQR